ncbi:MAG: RNA polymerase sigma factor [Acidimicrobiia bacterium]
MTDAQSNDEVFRKHVDELMRFATGLVGPFDAADVVNDACLSAFAARAWPDVADRRAYLYRSVLNTARSVRRSDLRRHLRELKTAPAESVTDSHTDLDVLVAVDRLSTQQRAVVVLTYWEDLTVSAVAERLGISAGSVKRHLHRARSRLKEWLDE